MVSAASSIAAALQASFSPDAAVRKPAEASLASYEHLPEYWPGLLAVIAERAHLDTAIRRAAAIQLKNGCERFWRKSAQHAIPANVKAEMRTKTLELLDEPDQPIGKSLEICIARMGRWDYDGEWPDLPNRLLQLLTTNFGSHPLIARRALSAIKQVIKILSSVRMPRGKLMNQKFCQAVFPTILSLYQQAIQSWSAETAGANADDQLEFVYLAFKNMRLILTYGWTKLDSDAQAVAALQASLSHLQFTQRIRLQALRDGVSGERRDLMLLERLVMSYIKLYKNLLVQDASCVAAMGLTAPIIDACRAIVQDAALDPENMIGDERASPYPEAFMAKVLVVLKLCLVDWGVDVPHPDAVAVALELTRLIVTRLLVLRQRDLEAWTADPEEWANVNDADFSDFEMRPCASSLMKALSTRYPDVSSIIKQLLDQVSDPHNASSIIAKDAVYSVVGQCAPSLAAVIDLDHWLDASLITEALAVSAESRVIRRRIAALLGEWAGDDATSTARSKAYRLIVQLLTDVPGSDVAVRLAAAQALETSIGQSWQFDEQAFLPYLGEAMQHLLKLLFDCSLPDSQLKVNNSIGVLVERMAQHIAPFTEQLLRALPVLWENAGETDLLRVSVLTTMAKLVDALGEPSQALHAQIAPLIALSVDPLTDRHVFLQEDGIDLYLAVMRQTTALEQPLLDLLPILLRLLSAGTDVLPKTLRIFESYFLLDGARVLALCGADFFTHMQYLLGDIKVEAARALLHTLSIATSAAPSSAWALPLESTGCFRKLLEPLQSEATALIKSKYLTLLARLVIYDVDVFLHCITSTASQLAVSERDLFHLVLQQWFDKLDNLQVGQRKLVALALAFLAGKGVPPVLERMAEVFAVWLVPLSETEEGDTGDAHVYRTDIVSEAAGLDDDFSVVGDVVGDDCPDRRRRSQMIERDPVHAVRLVDVVQQQLGLVEVACGGAEQMHARYLKTVDPLVLDELTRRLRGELKG